MSKSLLGNLWMNSGCQHVSGMAVTQIMQAHSPQIIFPNELHEGMRKRTRLQRRAIGLCNNIVITGQPDTELQKALRLLDSVTAQFFDQKRRHHYSALAARFGFLLPASRLGLFRARNNG